MMPDNKIHDPDETAANILRKNGRSFYFANLFLTKEQSDRAARLYAFCRYVDDLADETPDKSDAARKLAHVRKQVETRVACEGRVTDFLALADETGLDLSIATALIDGVTSDLGEVAFATEADLLRYAYRVAGTVGLMMCSLLGVRNDEAYPFAIDLGVAMQLTNIARDIKEDAENGRRYIPATWVDGASASSLAGKAPDLRPALSRSAARLIDLAEEYYESAYDGLGYLPPRARFAILIAARVYRQIGIKLKRDGFQVWRGRTIVGLAEKVVVSGGASWSYLNTTRLRRPQHAHESRLHVCLGGLSGANVG